MDREFSMGWLSIFKYGRYKVAFDEIVADPHIFLFVSKHQNREEGNSCALFQSMQWPWTFKRAARCARGFRKHRIAQKAYARASCGHSSGSALLLLPLPVPARDRCLC
jgi:hypothetical protein